MPIRNYPLKALAADRIGTATSGAWDYSNYETINVTVNANTSVTLSGITAGQTKKALVFNSHATNTIGITLPTAISDPSPAYIPAQKYVRFTIFNDGTNNVITYSGVLD